MGRCAPCLCFVVVALAAVVTLALLGARNTRRLEASVAVPVKAEAAVIRPGGRLCARPLSLPVPVNAVQVPLVTGGADGPTVVTTIHRGRRGATLREARIKGGYRAVGYPVPRPRTALFPKLRAGSKVTICVSNAGARAVALYAGRPQRSRRSHGITVVSLEDRPRSFVSTIPAIFERAAVFRPSGVGVAAFWALLAALLLGIPALLVRSLAVAASPADRHR